MEYRSVEEGLNKVGWERYFVQSPRPETLGNTMELGDQLTPLDVSEKDIFKVFKSESVIVRDKILMPSKRKKESPSNVTACC